MSSLFAHMSFRRRLTFALGFLSMLVALVAAIALWGGLAIDVSADHMEQQSQRSYLAS